MPQIRLGIPPAEIVVDVEAWIPLRELVQRTVASHPVGAVLGNVEVPRRRQCRAVSGREWLGEVRLHDRAFAAQLQRAPRALAVRRDFLETLDDVTAREVARAEARLGGKDVRVE